MPIDIRGIVMWDDDGRFEAVPIEDIRPDLDALLWDRSATPSVAKMGSKDLPMYVRCWDRESKATLIAFVAAR